MPNRPTANRSSTPAVRDEQFARLSLARLREYRAALTAEEHRVSYWRRILQARIDLVAATEAGEMPQISTLPATLTQPAPEKGRQVLLALVPDGGIPPLPELQRLWHREPSAEDTAGNAALVAELREAERSLSGYRRALHDRLGVATGELIARYREEPSLCLCALPQPPGRSAAAVGS